MLGTYFPFLLGLLLGHLRALLGPLFSRFQLRSAECEVETDKLCGVDLTARVQARGAVGGAVRGKRGFRDPHLDEG